MRRAALLAIVLATGCVNRNAQEQAKRTEKLVTDPTIAVVVEPVSSRRISEVLTVTGAIAAGEQSQVGSPVGGRLVSVYVRDGDPVSAGQLIAQIDTSDLTIRVQQALAQARAARSTYNQAVIDAKAAPTKSSAAVKAAEARLSQAREMLRKLMNGARAEERTQAEWNVKRTKSDLDTAQAALNRANRLYAEGAVARVEVETAENRFANAQAAYEGALQNLSMVQNQTRPEDIAIAREDVRAAEESLRIEKANQSSVLTYDERVSAARANVDAANQQVALAQKSLRDAQVRSPFGGRISGRPLQAGVVVQPGTPIVTVTGGQQLYFEAQVPGAKIAEVNLGSSVQVQIQALGETKFEGKVLAVNPQASSVGRLFTVRVALLDGNGQIKPGMFALGKVTLSVKPDAHVVQERAVIGEGDLAHVFVAQGEKAVMKKVKVGLKQGNFVEVDGLKRGDQVVVSGQNGLTDGSKIKVEKESDA